MGYRLVPEKAFFNVHPDILLKLDPKPDLKRMNKPDVEFRKSVVDTNWEKLSIYIDRLVALETQFLIILKSL